SAELFFHRVEKLPPRSGRPFADPRRLRAGANRPRAVEAEKVIDPHAVEVLHHRSKPPHPPLILSRLMRRPAVMRVAPELPVRTETIRRAPRNDRRLPRAVEHEQLRMRPHVTTVAGDEN